MFNEGDVDLDLCCVSSHLPQQGRLQQEPVRCKISLERRAAAMQLHTPIRTRPSCIGMESPVAWMRFWRYCRSPSSCSTWTFYPKFKINKDDTAGSSFQQCTWAEHPELIFQKVIGHTGVEGCKTAGREESLPQDNLITRVKLFAFW